MNEKNEGKKRKQNFSICIHIVGSVLEKWHKEINSVRKRFKILPQQFGIFLQTNICEEKKKMEKKGRLKKKIFFHFFMTIFSGINSLLFFFTFSSPFFCFFSSKINTFFSSKCKKLKKQFNKHIFPFSSFFFDSLKIAERKKVWNLANNSGK